MNADALPVREALPALLATLGAGRNAVLVAPPGAGKTTLVPPALLGQPWCRRVVMLEPRRLAARAAAARMAAGFDEPVGETAGFRTRLEAAVSARTRIEVVTDGLLLRRLLADPSLDGVDAVIFDEVHERGLELDQAIAFCLDLRRLLRPELRLLAMSATADGARLSALFDAPVVESAGRAFPVEIRHAARDLPHLRDLPDAVARAVRAALAAHPGDVLAFLPGMGEIRRAMRALEGCGAIVLPLHGELPPAEQDRALRPAPEGRRVVLATSIAETSLTVPGVRVVVDGGWRRAPSLDAGTGLTRLVTRRIGRAAAEQRAGRAGREAPGVAIRLWTAALHRGLPPFERPEMMEAELSGLVLNCAAWGTPPASLPFPDPPPPGALRAGAALLETLGATEGGALTDHGRAMAALGAHPRLAAMMLAAETPDETALAATLAALLEERDPLRAGPDAPCAIALRLEAVAHGGAPAGMEADRGAIARIRQQAAVYRRRLRAPGAEPVPGGDPGRLLAAGFPDRLAGQRNEPGAFRLAGGGGARLPRGDALAGAKLLVAAALDMKLGARIRLAAPLDPANLPPAIAARVTETTETAIDPITGSVLRRRRRRFGALVLSDRTETADPALGAEALADAALADWAKLPWTEQTRQLQARAALLRGLEPGLPDLSDAALRADAREWLAPHLAGLTRLADLARLDLAQLLRERLGGAWAAQLDRMLPAQLALPQGRAQVDYTQPVPVASARAQCFYGLRETPRLAGGRVALRLALLSPAGRPAAITADLAGFWAGAWAEVRKEMRGRYPRHDWPERPDGDRGA